MRDFDGQMSIDVALTEKMKQAIRNEPRRRIDEAPGKRATEQDLHFNATTSASAQQEDKEENDEQKCKMSGVSTEQEAKVASEDEEANQVMGSMMTER